jgi:hypothetical protein
MCMFSSPKSPPPVKPVELPPPAPTQADPEVTKAGIANKRKAALAAGNNNTILTSGFGLTSTGNTASKTALGS